MSGGRRWSEEDVAYLVSRYGSESNKSIAAALGRTWEAVGEKARTLGLHKDVAYLCDMKVKSVANARACSAEHPEVRIAKLRATANALARRERIRYLYGLKPLTRWLTPLGQTKAKRWFRFGLREKGLWEFVDAMGYFYYEDGAKIRPQTWRAAERYGIKLRPLSEYHGNFKTRGKKPFVAPTNNEFDYDI